MEFIINNCELSHTWNNTPYYSYKNKDLILFVNNDFDYQNAWISITTHGCFYLAWNNGRIKSSIHIIKNELGAIKNIEFNDEMYSFSFDYEGEWEDESENDFQIIKVHKRCRLYFDRSKHYRIIKVIYELNE